LSLGFAEHLEHFSRRFVQEVIDDATAAYYLKRAQAFEDAKPKPGDFHGQATVEELREQWLRLDQIATACRARAGVSLFRGRIEPEVDQALRGVA
jgi:hypothetical protein